MTDAMGQTELAALRARAYGPDADIHSDAAAMARLRQLEEAERGAAGERVSTAHAEAVDAVVVDAATPAGAPWRSPRPEVADPDGFGGSDDFTAPQGPEKWWMQQPRVRIASLLFASAAMLVAAVIVTVSVTAAVMSHDPSVVARLHPDPTGEWPAEAVRSQFSEDSVLYERFEGGAVIVGHPDQNGQPELKCILFTTGTSPFQAAGCAYADLEPFVDFVVGTSGPDGLEAVFPKGTPLRFSLENGVVLVRAGHVVAQLG